MAHGLQPESSIAPSMGRTDRAAAVSWETQPNEQMCTAGPRAARWRRSGSPRRVLAITRDAPDEGPGVAVPSQFIFSRCASDHPPRRIPPGFRSCRGRPQPPKSATWPADLTPMSALHATAPRSPPTAPPPSEPSSEPLPDAEPGHATRPPLPRTDNPRCRLTGPQSPRVAAASLLGDDSDHRRRGTQRFQTSERQTSRDEASRRRATTRHRDSSC